MKFQTITIENKGLFRKFLAEYPIEAHEQNFTNLFSWRKSDRHEWAEYKGHLVVSFMEGSRKFYPPIGPNPHEIMKEMLNEFPGMSFRRVDKKIAEKLRDEFKIESDRANWDYVYSLDELKSLGGAKYARERNFVRKFQTYNPKICRLDSNSEEEFAELLDRWCDIKKCRDDAHMKAEVNANREALRNFKSLEIFGVCIRVNNRIAGYAIADELNSDTCVEHFEKADTNYAGIYQFILHELAKSVPPHLKFINREQDLGIPGLRKSKMAYNPIRFVEKYIVSKK
ncbi:MAG: DUF2156 domain-containing protein [Candidatus Omnitrophica bacterium]|nr:DUF2156 domain-containing protein [Candidatus Omnitrophota bacterium]